MEKIIDTQYADVRGFNYQPSYASHGIEIWGDAFDFQKIKIELGRGKKYFPKTNTIRLWLSFDAYIKNPKQMVDHFNQVLTLGQTYDLKFIPTLFNGWHSLPDFGGISVELLGVWGCGKYFDEVFWPYLNDIVGANLDNDCILLWDLCNEPFNNALCDQSKKIIFDWLAKVYSVCKKVGALAPITVGSIPELSSLEMLNPISDVLSYHPYYAWNCFRKTAAAYEANLDTAIGFANSVGKAMVATETGWGALDDQKRSEILEVELGGLAKRNVGFTAHLLHDTLVADGHRPEDGPITNAGYMAFIEKDGSLRPHHDIFNHF